MCRARKERTIPKHQKKNPPPWCSSQLCTHCPQTVHTVAPDALGELPSVSRMCSSRRRWRTFTWGRAEHRRGEPRCTLVRLGNSRHPNMHARWVWGRGHAKAHPHQNWNAWPARNTDAVGTHTAQETNRRRQPQVPETSVRTKAPKTNCPSSRSHHSLPLYTFFRDFCANRTQPRTTTCSSRQKCSPSRQCGSVRNAFTDCSSERPRSPGAHLPSHSAKPQTQSPWRVSSA